jgi:glycosyltransferase involved in cell wall biosynthesis
MRTSVVICTLGRPAVLNDTVQSLVNQDHPVDEVLVGSPSCENVMESTLQHPVVSLLSTPLGLTAQRNLCLANVLPSSELIFFVDDDMEFHHSYIAAMVALFEEQPHVVASSGYLLYDGGVGKGLSREKAVQLCASPGTGWAPGSRVRTSPRRFAYGCNMVYRASALRGIVFDENLPLYGWLEDSDFSHAVTKSRLGPVTNHDACAVHLGWRGGRIDGRRLGFSQIVNPCYLWRKSRVFSLRHIIVHFWLRCLVGNTLGLLFGEPIEDRPGRFHGNVLGGLHLLQGKADPRQVLCISGRSHPVNPGSNTKQPEPTAKNAQVPFSSGSSSGKCSRSHEASV